MRGMEESAAKNPNKKLDIKLALEDGDMVATHSHLRQRPDDIGGAVVHIFRIKNGQIVELWDLGQEIPKDSVNKNGMF
jgi:predicted SnoaL-like aldol condensation-catalyzing enzyme